MLALIINFIIITLIALASFSLMNRDKPLSHLIPNYLWVGIGVFLFATHFIAYIMLGLVWAISRFVYLWLTKKSPMPSERRIASVFYPFVLSFEALYGLLNVSSTNQ